jgi:hypothetical protein
LEKLAVTARHPFPGGNGTGGANFVVGVTFGEKMLSAMPLGFGGHIEGKEPIDPEVAQRGPAPARHAAECCDV